VNAEEHAAAGVLDDHFPETAGEEVRVARAHGPVVVAVAAVELVGDDKAGEQVVVALVVRGDAVKHPGDVKRGSSERVRKGRRGSRV
jgi:hypothetical protein